MAAGKYSLESILTLYDNMTAPMRGIENGAAGLSRKMKTHVGGMTRMWRGLHTVIGGVLAGISIGAATKAVKDFADHTDEISRMSNILGLNTTAWQENVYAAKLSDMTAEDLASTFKKMNNSLGQMTTGSGALFTFLKKSNPQLALQLLHTKDSADAFGMLMDAIAAETDVQKRAALTQAAFGKGGQPLIEMAMNYRDLVKEARDSGGIINPEDVAAGKELHENLKKLAISGRGFFNIILGRAVKVLGPLIQKLTEWVAANREMIGQKVERFISGVVRVAKLAYDIFKKWGWVILWVGGAIVLMNVALKVAMIIQVVGKAFAVASAVMVMFQSGASLATVAQWALNAAMDANPAGAVILALMALIVVVILVIKYWREITTVLRECWNWFNKLFSNPWIANAVFFLLSPLWLVIAAVRTLVDLLSGKGWRSFENLIPPWAKSLMGIGGYKEQAGAGNWAAPGEGQTTGFGALRGAERSGYASPKTATSSTSSTREEKIMKDFVLHLPKGFGISEPGGPEMDEYSSDLGEQ